MGIIYNTTFSRKFIRQSKGKTLEFTYNYWTIKVLTKTVVLNTITPLNVKRLKDVCSLIIKVIIVELSLKRFHQVFKGADKRNIKTRLKLSKSIPILIRWYDFLQLIPMTLCLFWHSYLRLFYCMLFVIVVRRLKISTKTERILRYCIRDYGLQEGWAHKACRSWPLVLFT